MRGVSNLAHFEVGNHWAKPIVRSSTSNVIRRRWSDKLVRYLACTGQAAVLLIPLQATGQQANLEIKADVRVREDSFACKEISELDRLLQINQRGGFTSGPNCTIICNATVAWD